MEPGSLFALHSPMAVYFFGHDSNVGVAKRVFLVTLSKIAQYQTLLAAGRKTKIPFDSLRSLHGLSLRMIKEVTKSRRILVGSAAIIYTSFAYTTKHKKMRYRRQGNKCNTWIRILMKRNFLYHKSFLL